MFKNFIHLACVFSLFLASTLHAREAELELINGDKLEGEVISLSPPVLHFMPKLGSQAKVLEMNHLRSLRYIHQQNAKKTDIGVHLTLFKRFNASIPSDLYMGVIESIDDDHILINTAYAGKLSILKRFVQHLTILDYKNITLNGLGQLSDWEGNPNKSNVTQEGESFKFAPIPKKSTPPLIHKEVNFPEKYQLNFTLTTSPSLKFRNYLDPKTTLHFHSNNEGERTSNTLSLSISRYIIQAYFKENRTNKTIGSIKFPSELYKEKKLTASTYVDTVKGTLSFWLNKKLIFDEIKIGEFNPKDLSKHLSFSTLSQNPITLSDLTIRRWDGFSFSQANNQLLAITGQTGKAIELKNGDTMYGTVTNIDNGIAQIETKYGHYRMNLGKIISFDLAVDKKNQLIMQKNDARITFSDGSNFIIKIEKYDNQKLRGSSPSFQGVQEFDIANITSIEFEKSIYP